MIKNRWRGKFILVEGIDGAGKTTALKDILQYFAEHFDAVYLKGVAGNGFFGRLAKKFLAGWAFALELLHTTYFCLMPALQNGKLVLMDKYFFFVASHVPESERILDRLAFGCIAPFVIRPDLVIYFQCSPEERIRRLRNMPYSAAHQRIINNPSWIMEREKAYLQKFALSGVRVVSFDNTDLNIEETSRVLQEFICDFMTTEVPHGS